MKNILVTGGAGYIGSHAVVELLDSGYNVIVLDNLENGYIELVDKRAKFYQGDIRDINSFENIFKENEIDAVMNFAGYIKVGESVFEPNKYYLNNTYGVMNVVEVMKKYNVKNIIFSSTAAVYGEVKCDGLVYEDYPTAPINPYGASKLMAERVIIDAAKAYGINYSIFRYFNVGGAHEKYHIGQKGDGVTALIPIILQAAKGEREKLSIYGDDYPTKDGTGIRDYIHVVDLVRAHIAALPALDKNISGIYNLGNGNGFSVLEMLNAAKKVTNVDIKSEVVEKREGDPASVVAASEKARDILGWKPEYTDVEKIIETAWNWYRSL
ncbi:UDP-glucose 4-epimerase GalE [Cetobacterium sp. 2G large]|uniref:UDP-glucose 4-epimerase GalE n=1 Tax=Cetobacterium sp. 2G large TaxID=2759680 RepID=UPI00163BDD7B|nr:UDP-glucose 4-epimerase GalE [Cetobacterium sp. 2G large]MBC2852788.1 UDP-glucose 4-epimerase GalE [Cetobacterium sp. 2G large]MBC2854858.1 UDP-glucose 4-epimerase GalE [Cetobacterium sp. 2G large]